MLTRGDLSKNAVTVESFSNRVKKGSNAADMVWIRFDLIEARLEKRQMGRVLGWIWYGFDLQGLNLGRN